MKTLIFLGAIPFFLLMIFLESWLGKRQGKTGMYRLNDTITNLNIGIGNQVFNLFAEIAILGAYFWLFSNLAPWELPTNAGTVLLGILVFDFLFYWAHRWSHEINFWWGAHVVHHSSEEYNLSVALRQSWFHNVMAFFIFIPMPLLGFHPATFFIAGALHTLYQFWIHTKTVDKLPFWLEAFLNTPSHHRVHHGVNPQYIDKNHGGVLIIWDRLFGTFEPEQEEVIYGITEPLKSWNPAWANFHYYAEMFRVMGQMKGRDRWKMLLARPGWRPDYLGGPIEVRKADPLRKKFNRQPPALLNIYVLGQFAMVLGGLCAFMFHFEELTWTFRLVFGGIMMLSLVLCGGILENKSWVIPLEYIRLTLVLAALNSLYYFHYLDWFVVMVIASGTGFLLLNCWFTWGWRKAGFGQA